MRLLQLLVQESCNLPIGRNSVAELDQTVARVREAEVLHVDLLFPHRFDESVGLRNRVAGIVGAMHHQQWRTRSLTLLPY